MKVQWQVRGDNRPLSLFDKYTQYLDAGRMVLNLPPVSLFTINADAPPGRVAAATARQWMFRPNEASAQLSWL